MASRGCRLSSRHFVLMAAEQPVVGNLAPEGDVGARLGLTVSRRVGGAVVRNRVKRRLRHWFRSARGAVDEPLDLVVVARAGVGEIGFDEATTELDRLVTQLADRRRRKRGPT